MARPFCQVRSLAAGRLCVNLENKGFMGTGE